MRRRAEVGGGLLVLRPDRDEPAAHDHTTYESVNVTWPIACAVVPRPSPGRSSGRAAAARRPSRARASRAAAASRVDRARAPPAPALQAERERDPERCRDETQSTPRKSVCLKAPCSAGSWNTLPVAPVNQRSEKPCQVVRERPLLNAKGPRSRPAGSTRGCRARSRRRASAASPTDCAASVSRAISRSRALGRTPGRAQVIEHQHEQHEREQNREHRPVTFSEPWRVNWSIWLPIMFVFGEAETRSGV